MTLGSLAAAAVLLAAPASVPAHGDGRGSGQQNGTADTARRETGPVRVELKTAAGAGAGTVTLTETPNGVLVSGELRNIAAGERAMHIHKTGRCDAPSFESAGDHFAPRGHKHGFKVAAGPHAGDLPNVHVRKDGPTRFEVLASELRLTGEHGLLDEDGAALIVHARPDDYVSQPAGNAGDRIACGVIAAPRP